MTLPDPATSLQPTSNPHAPSPDGSDLTRKFENLAPLLVVTTAFVVRLLPAWRYFLNPDEALHNLLASEPSLDLAYKAALTNAHPPLLILVLYYWRWLGQSELMLRMPSVLAGTASCWFVYQWLKLLTSRTVAWIGLLLFAFAPTLIWMSAEVRQYPLLLFFMTTCLYLLERAVGERSPSWMILSSLSLYGALLTHYSSLLFAFTIGVYMLARLYPYGRNLRLFGLWAVGQAGGVSIAGYYLFTHVRSLRANGMVREVAETYVRKSLFHAGENHVAGFVARQTLRFFTYLFSHGVVGTVALLAFLAGLFLLLKGPVPWTNGGASRRQLALLLGLPFLVECGAALAGVYPYGGTRHCIQLAPFAVAGISIAIANFWPARLWTKSLVIVVALALCNIFPSPPPLIRARNQARTRMVHAVDALRRSAPPGSIIFADHESGLLLGYYACGHGVVQVFPPFVPFSRADCGAYTVMTPPADKWKFYASDLPANLAGMAAVYGLAPGTRIWLFYAGWINDSAPTLSREPRVGCSTPERFGENILICELAVPEPPISGRDAFGAE
jgi:hypothetical protein